MPHFAQDRDGLELFKSDIERPSSPLGSLEYVSCHATSVVPKLWPPLAPVHYPLRPPRQDFETEDAARTLMDSAARFELQLRGCELRLEYSHTPPAGGSAAAAAAGGLHGEMPLDWQCEMCQAINFSRWDVEGWRIRLVVVSLARRQSSFCSLLICYHARSNGRHGVKQLSFQDACVAFDFVYWTGFAPLTSNG